LGEGEDRLDEAELAEARGQRLGLVFADLARIGWVPADVIDRDVVEGQG